MNESYEQYPHFKIKTADGIELDLIETKYYTQLLKEYKKLKQDYKDLEKETNDFLDCWIHIDKVINLKLQREFELQQKYKEFKDDVEWQTYNKILEERKK